MLGLREKPFQKMSICGKPFVRQKFILILFGGSGDVVFKKLQIVAYFYGKIPQIIGKGFYFRIVLIQKRLEVKIKTGITRCSVVSIQFFVFIQRFFKNRFALQIIFSVFPLVYKFIVLSFDKLFFFADFLVVF